MSGMGFNWDTGGGTMGPHSGVTGDDTLGGSITTGNKYFGSGAEYDSYIKYGLIGLMVIASIILLKRKK